MQTVAMVLFFLALACGVLALVGLVIPRVAFFLKNKSRPKAALSFLGIGLVLVMTAGAIAPELPQTPGESTAKDLSVSKQSIPHPDRDSPTHQGPNGEEKKAEEEKRQVYLRVSMSAQKELREIFNALVELNKSEEFHEVGFSASSPKATKAREWRTRAEAFSERMTREHDVAGEIRIASPALMQLALELTRNPSAITDMQQFSLQVINEGLAWEMPPN